MTIPYKSPRNLQFLLEKFLHSDLGNVQCFSNWVNHSFIYVIQSWKLLLIQRMLDTFEQNCLKISHSFFPYQNAYTYIMKYSPYFHLDSAE